MNMNGFEQQVVNVLRRNMSKREAEQALYWIREGIYGDSYHQIRPNTIIHSNQSITKEYPEIEDIISAYDSGDYSQVQETLGVEPADIEEPTSELSPEEFAKHATETLEKLNIPDFIQNSPHHYGSFYEHTQLVAKYAATIKEDYYTGDPNIYNEKAFLDAAIYHDIGKYDTKGINEKTGYSTYLKHEEASAEKFKKMIGASQDPEQTEYTAELIRLHGAKYSKQGKCQELLNNHPDGFANDLIALQFVDVMGQSDYQKKEKLEQVKEFATRLTEVSMEMHAPEKTEGIDNICNMINKYISKVPENTLTKTTEIEHTVASNRTILSVEEYIAQQKEEASTPPDADANTKIQKQVIRHDASTDKNIKIKGEADLWNMEKPHLFSRTYENNGIKVSFYDSMGADDEMAHSGIDGSLSCVVIDGKFVDGDYEYNDYGEMTTLKNEEELYEALHRAIDLINERENRTEEPYYEIIEDTIKKETIEKVWLARTAGNQDVYIDKDTYEHMQAHPDVNMAHIVEAIGKIKDYDEQFRIGSIDLERPIGKDHCIERTDDMQIDMLVRKGRDGQTPIILEENGFTPKDTNDIVIGICKDNNDGENTFFTGFYGELAPKEPWDKSIQDDPEKLAESKAFWDTHVLIQTSDMIDWDKSETLKEKAQSVQEKSFADMSGDERIEKALKNHEGSTKDTQSKNEPIKDDTTIK